MKKIPEYTSDDDMFFYMNALVDLVNSQQEAIEKLEKVITRDTVRIVTDDIIDALSEPADDKPEMVDIDKTNVNDTHRTVTLRIPKGMTVGEALSSAYRKSGNDYVTASKWLYLSSDTDLQKALDGVEK